MKKFILISILGLFVFAGSSQVLTKTTKVLPYGTSYMSYTGVAVDTLSSNQDSIQFPVMTNADTPFKLNISAEFAKRSGNDTLVTMRLYGRNFDSEGWTWLATDASPNVTTATIQNSLTYGTASMYRQLKLNFVILGTKSTGVKITKIEAKYWKQ